MLDYVGCFHTWDMLLQERAADVPVQKATNNQPGQPIVRSKSKYGTPQTENQIRLVQRSARWCQKMFRKKHREAHLKLYSEVPASNLELFNSCQVRCSRGIALFKPTENTLKLYNHLFQLFTAS